MSRNWRKVKGDWVAWNARLLAGEPVVRLILGAQLCACARHHKITAISLLVVIGMHADGPRVLLAVKRIGGGSADAWRARDAILRHLSKGDACLNRRSIRRRNRPRMANGILDAIHLTLKRRAAS